MQGKVDAEAVQFGEGSQRGLAESALHSYEAPGFRLTGARQ
jgi:hypothetical protein